MKFLALAAILASTAMTPLAAQQASETQAEASSADDGGLDDIIVTAQRREESLQDVPVAVTAFDAKALSTLRVTNVRDLTGLAPNLQVTAQGLQSTPNINIRGISSGTANNAVDPKVGIYIDGVYIGRTIGAVLDLADIERVEVLRGPQGTLFGRNATAGALSLSTSAPTGEFGLKQSLSYGSSKALRSRTVLNLPSFGPLSVKVAYLHDEMEGDVDNLLGGRSIDLRLRAPEFGTFRFADKLGGRNIDAVQIAARLQPADSVTVDYRFDHSDSRSVGRASQLLGTLPGSAGALHAGILGFQGVTGGITNLSQRPLQAVAAATSPEHVKVQGHSLTVTWNQSDAVTVKSITAFRRMHQNPYIYDLGASGGIRFTAGQFGALLRGNTAGIAAMPVGANDSFFSLMTSRESRQKQISQELQFQVTQDWFQLVAGGFYFHERAPEIGVAGVFQPVVNGVVVPSPFDASFGSGTTRSTTINDSMALYGQATFHITDQFDLTGGLRLTQDDRQTNLITVSGVQGGTLKPGTYKTGYRRLNYSAIATWRPAGNITAYGKVSTGYVSGGIMNAIPYGPESLTSYELGVKSQLFDNRLRANIALFYMDYRDLQTSSFTNGVVSFVNAGRAKVPGFEVELDAVPVRGLTLSGSAGYSDFKYDEFFINGIDVAKTTRPAYFSKWTSRGSVQFDFPEFSSGGNVFARLDARWRSDSKLVATRIADPRMEALGTTKAYWLVDGRLGLTSFPIGGTTARASLYGQNLLNKRYYSWGAPVIGLAAVYDRGRTYGLDLSFDF